MSDQKQNPSGGNENFNENIFKELAWELDFGEKKDENIEIKDPLEKMKKATTGLTFLNIFLAFVLILFWVYAYIQNNPNIKNAWYLDVFCPFILWDYAGNTLGSELGCSSVTALAGTYQEEAQKLKGDIAKKLDEVVIELYEMENFWSSRDVAFVLSRSVNKTKAINMLNDFDRLKNTFSSDKKEIICKNIKITSDYVLEANCEVFSSTWERVNSNLKLGIIWDSWDRNDLIEWTSISWAASFLNFIEKNPEYNFQVLTKQKVFSSEPTLVWWYVKKTKLDLKLKYNNLVSNLSL